MVEEKEKIKLDLKVTTNSSVNNVQTGSGDHPSFCLMSSSTCTSSPRVKHTSYENDRSVKRVRIHGAYYLHPHYLNQ
jgi:hypothetical protein